MQLLKIRLNYLRKISFSLILSLCFCSNTYANENKLFWDGRDWNRVPKSVGHDEIIIYKLKSAYLLGSLDGRLYYYLKTWNKDQKLADGVFNETVDYLSIRELIKNIDYFYEDPLNIYIPVPSAILIANMYAERTPIAVIELYIKTTRRWINNLILDLDTLNYNKLLEEKLIKHLED